VEELSENPYLGLRLVGELEEFWKDLGADKRKFFIEGKIASSLPEIPNLGIAHQRFHAEFTIPKL
jgi:hypothetical protein